MERRHFLKLAFGLAAGGVALAASAQAAPLMPHPLVGDDSFPPIRMPIPPSRRAMKSIASHPNRCAGAAAVIAAGATVIGAGAAVIGAGVAATGVGAAGTGAGIAAAGTAAATGAAVTGKALASRGQGLRLRFLPFPIPVTAHARQQKSPA